MFAKLSLDIAPNKTVGGKSVLFAMVNYVIHMVAMRFVGIFVLSFVATLVDAGPLLPPGQTGNLVEMTNANVRLEYDLSTGRANFYWQNSLKISGFYAGVGLYSGDVLTNYITGTIYSNRTWTVTNNEVDITLTGGGVPMMKQIFILDQDNSFLTRVDMMGGGLQSRWMGPVVMDMTGGVDVGTYNDDRALIVPFDNDSFTFSYDAMLINNTSTSYEASAFYDNTTRNGLVVGSVTHDTWKTGVYFQGSNNKLDVLNVFGGETSTNTRDVMSHGLVTGNTISSPTVFVGFGADWRATMEDYADANAAMAPKLAWNGGVPFGWNSWYAYGSGVSYSNATAVSSFIENNLQTNNFNDNGVVYINLDANGLADSDLTQFVNFCHANGQKTGIYWTPFVYWGTATQGSNVLMGGSLTYHYSDAYLRTTDGSVQTVDNGIALDPTHPGTLGQIAYYINYFKSKGFDYIKMDFLTHGALEGVHYDTNVTTGIQAYNQGMQYIVAQNSGRMFLNESIAPIFPYQYANSRRIYCDASTTITDTMNTMQAVSYGWWINSRLYQFSDPDMMKFSGGTANENQSRLINCAIAGTVFLNSDDLTSTAGQNLAWTCMTNEAIDEVARAGVSFLPVEGNTGTNATDTFVRQDGSTWYVAVFNYTAFSANKSLNLARLGISGAYTAEDLWSGALSTVSGTTWNVSLGSEQAKLFRLGFGSTGAVGPVNQSTCVGGSVTLSTTASGTPPFSYVWKKNGTMISGRNANALTINPVSLGDAGTYAVVVSGGNGNVTNSAILTVAQPPLKWATGSADWNSTNPVSWADSTGTNAVYCDGTTVVLDDTASGVSPIIITANQWETPATLTVSNVTKDYTIQGDGGISGGLTALTKTGSGRLILATDNGYSGPTTINAGTLQIGNDGTSGTLGSGYVTNNATLAFDRSDDYTLPVLSDAYPAFHGGPGTLAQIGTGRLLFNYQYVFGPWVSTPNQGLYVGPNSTAETSAYNPVGPVTLEGGTLSSSGGASSSYQSWVLCGGVTVLSNVQTSVITNNFAVNAFSQIELRDDTVFDVASGATNGIDLLVSAVLTHSYYEYDNWGTLVKTGNGKMVLSAANLYQGETIISNGTLSVQSPGSIGSSGFPVTVLVGGHFGGTGIINRNTSVQTGGFLEPGDDDMSIGVLTINGNLTLAGTTEMKLNKSLAPSNDLVNVSGTLTFGGTLAVTNLGPALADGDSFKLFNETGTASFANINLPILQNGLGWTNKLAVDGSIAVIQSVSLNPANLVAQSNDGNLTLSWPADHIGWHLQSQTNSLGTNWWDVIGSEATNSWTVPISATNQSVFCRLIYP
jgi:alpha-galactosidase